MSKKGPGLREEKLSHNLKLLVSAALIVFTASILSKVFSYVYRIIVARYLGPEIYGSLMLLMAILGFFVAFGSLGFSDGIQRFIPKYLGEKRNDKGNYIISLSLKLSIISSLISAVILFIFADKIA